MVLLIPGLVRPLAGYDFGEGFRKALHSDRPQLAASRRFSSMRLKSPLSARKTKINRSKR
jgi:hypothetical protein